MKKVLLILILSLVCLSTTIFSVSAAGIDVNSGSLNISKNYTVTVDLSSVYIVGLSTGNNSYYSAFVHTPLTFIFDPYSKIVNVDYIDYNNQAQRSSFSVTNPRAVGDMYVRLSYDNDIVVVPDNTFYFGMHPIAYYAPQFAFTDETRLEAVIVGFTMGDNKYIYAGQEYIAPLVVGFEFSNGALIGYCLAPMNVISITSEEYFYNYNTQLYTRYVLPRTSISDLDGLFNSAYESFVNTQIQERSPIAYRQSYNETFNTYLSNYNDLSWHKLIRTVLTVPIKAMDGLFDIRLFNYDLRYLPRTLFTLALITFFIRRLL